VVELLLQASILPQRLCFWLDPFCLALALPNKSLQYDPTIEDSYRKQVVIDGQACMLEVLDTAGQEEYTALRDQWIRDGEGFVLVYSISSRSSFTRIKRFHHQIQRVKESVAFLSTYPGVPLSTKNPAPVPIMLVGNEWPLMKEREVSRQEGQALARELGCEFVEASVETGINVEKPFYDVVRLLRRQRQARNPSPQRQAMNQPQAPVAVQRGTNTLRVKDFVPTFLRSPKNEQAPKRYDFDSASVGGHSQGHIPKSTQRESYGVSQPSHTMACLFIDLIANT